VAGRGERARGRARRWQGEGESCDEPRGDLQPAELMSTALVLCSPNCAIRFARTSYRTVAVHENSRPPSLPFPLPSFFSSLFSSSPFFFSSPFFLFLVSRAVRAEKIRRKNIDDDGLYRRATRRKAVFDLGRGGGAGEGRKAGGRRVGKGLAPRRVRRAGRAGWRGSRSRYALRKGLRARLYGTNFTLRCRNSRESAVVFASFLPFFSPFFFPFPFLFFSFLFPFFSFSPLFNPFSAWRTEALLRVAAIRDWA